MSNKHSIAQRNLGNPQEPKLFVKLLKTIEITPASLRQIKKKPIFDFPEATTEHANEIIKSLNPNKATGPDRIPLKIIKTAANIIDYHLAYIINKDLKENKFSENAKTALMRPI